METHEANSAGDCSSRFKTLLACAAIVVLTAVAYTPAVTAGFVWDDGAHVVNNAMMRDLQGLWQIWTVLFQEGIHYYPVTFSSFWLEYQLWQDSPSGYHVVNIALHILNALLIARILQFLRIRGAWWIALVFALHPVNVESVAWISERKNVLSAFFYFVSMLYFLYFDTQLKWRFYWVSIACFALALLAKTATCTLPVALLIILHFKGRPLSRTLMLRLAPFFLLALGMGLITVGVEAQVESGGSEDLGLSWLQRILLANKAILFYAQKLLYPHPLLTAYPRWNLETSSLFSLWPVFLNVCVGGWLLVLWRRQHRGPVYAICYYVASLFPILGVFYVSFFRVSYVADHYQYLASPGLIVLLVGGLLCGLDKIAGILQERIADSGKCRRQVFVAQWGIGIYIAFMLAALTWFQTHYYKDSKSLWEHTALHNRGSWFVYSQLGMIYYNEDALEQALVYLNESIRLNPDDYGNYLARGLTHLKTGDYEKAVGSFDDASRLPHPKQADLYFYRGFAHQQTGRSELAILDYRKAIEIGSTDEYGMAARERLTRLLSASQ